MTYKQKEFTLEDVRKMTLEEFRRLPQKQKEAFTPEQRAEIKDKIAREERIKSADFINNKSFREFLAENGYEIVGYDHNRYNFENRYIHFGAFGEYERDFRHTDRGLILIGPGSEWDESIEGFTVKNIVGNPFVKYLDWGLTEFKVYKIANNSGAEGFGSDEPLYCGKLEKDLSNEWIKFWALREEDYAKYMLAECHDIRKKAPQDVEYYGNLLARDIARLEAEYNQRMDGVNKKLNRYSEIEQIIKSTKKEEIKHNN